MAVPSPIMSTIIIGVVNKVLVVMRTYCYGLDGCNNIYMFFFQYHETEVVFYDVLFEVNDILQNEGCLMCDVFTSLTLRMVMYTIICLKHIL